MATPFLWLMSQLWNWVEQKRKKREDLVTPCRTVFCNELSVYIIIILYATWVRDHKYNHVDIAIWLTLLQCWQRLKHLVGSHQNLHLLPPPLCLILTPWVTGIVCSWGTMLSESQGGEAVTTYVTIMFVFNHNVALDLLLQFYGTFVSSWSLEYSFLPLHCWQLLMLPITTTCKAARIAKPTTYCQLTPYSVVMAIHCNMMELKLRVVQ